MSEHMPGPWTARQREYGYPHYKGGPEVRLWDVFNADGLTMAMGTIYPRGGNEANARLIAAAPDLLAALEAIADDMDKIAPNVEHTFGPGSWDARRRARELASIARAALAKALGRNAPAPAESDEAAS